jgi:dimethylargininase
MEYPATLDGGDVLRIGARLYVGASSRSNSPGIGQLRALVAPHGISVTPLLIRNCLHLKSAVTLVAPDSVLLNPAWVDRNNFPGMRVIEVSPTEPHAANALLLGDTVVYPTTFPDTADRLEQAGIRLRTVDVSELAKAEGGVTCSCLLVEE